MYIDSDQYVGIGTTNPWSSVAVRKDTNAKVEVGLWNNDAGTSAYAEFTAWNSSNGGAGFGVGGTGYTSTAIFQDRAYVYANSNLSGLVLDAGSGGGTAPLIFATSSLEKARFTQAGNLGIGTTNPIGSLDVRYPATSFGVNVISAASGNAINIDGGALGFNRYWDGSANKAIGPGYTGVFQINSATGDMVWHTGNNPGSGNTATLTNRMVLQQGGNVGIGTAAPNIENHAATRRVLSVVGSDQGILEVATTAADGVGVEAGQYSFAIPTNATGAKRIAKIFAQTEGALANERGGAMIFSTRNPTAGSQLFDRMIINSAGNVGIGTMAPAATLEVDGQIVSTTHNVASGATVNFANGNTQTLDSVGGSAITLQNMVDGGNYTLVVRDTTSRTYTFTGCNTSKYRPTNAATTATKETIYTILAIKNGANFTCYINWSSGY